MEQISWDVPQAPWATGIRSKRNPSRILPQAIAHRGYKAQWPENTMGAFKGAVAAGAHAVETDIHLSSDGVAVLSHDATLVRCFGIDKNLRDCTWEYLSKLETLRSPKQHLPRLVDLLEWLVESDKERELPSSKDKTWVLLDIKLDDDAQDLMNAIEAAIQQVPSSTPWESRIVLGCWNASALLAARKTLPSFPLAHIGFSLSYARHFLPVPNLGFNMAFHTLVRPLMGRRFMRDVSTAGRPLYAWTVNSERWMEWCIRQNVAGTGKRCSSAVQHKLDEYDDDDDDEGDDDADDAYASAVSYTRVIDGVVTDDPKLFLEVCERYEDKLDGKAVIEARSDGSSAGGVTGAFNAALDIVTRHFWAKLFFLYRRHVQHRLDDLDIRKLKAE